MDALRLLSDCGLSVAANGDKLLVAPREKLTDELRRYIREHKAELLALARSWFALEDAVNACCDARGDDQTNRQALLNDCRNEPSTDWLWYTEYLTSEAAKWTH